MIEHNKATHNLGGKMVKVHLKGPDGGDSETLWASPLGQDFFRIENSPFFAYGISWHDMVEAHPASDGMLKFVRRVTSSGNRTVRIIFEKFRSNDRQAQTILSGLTEPGCTYEGMSPRLISLNVPPEADLSSVTEFLIAQTGIQWEYADPAYDQVVKTRLN